MNTQPQFEFYEVVRVASDRPELSRVVGMQGAVLGRSASPDGTWSYSVQLTDSESVHFFGESDLVATGDKRRREDFYDGSTVKVSVDPLTGQAKATGDGTSSE